MKKTIVMVYILTLLIGCNNNYEIKESGGKLYRINNNTGDIDLINGDVFVRIHPRKSFDEIATEVDKEYGKQADKDK